jgi:cytochrome c-type biogenesis protein CcmH
MDLIPLAIVLAALAAIVLGFVFVPLARGHAGGGAGREIYARAVYRDQLRELERDREQGVIDDEQVEAARREIERRLLAADRPVPPSEIGPRPVLAAALALGALAVAGGFYALKGRPGLPDMPYVARQAERMNPAAPKMPLDLDKAAASLAAKLKADPNNLNGWILLSRTEAVRRHWEKSAEAMRHAMNLAKDRPDIATAYGEVQVLADGGFVLPQARDAFLAVLAKEPTNPRALWYLGLDAVQHRHGEAARGYWQRLLKQLPAGSDEYKTVAEALGTLDKALKRGVNLPR